MKDIKVNDIQSLSHTTWNCKYHIVFAPKYRRKVFYEEKRLEIGQILRQLCEWKGIGIIEAEVCPDHGKNTKKIKEYIANQLKEDKISDQMTIEEIDPFKG